MRLILLAVLVLNGCSTWSAMMRDPRDAPWDPKPGQTLFDQIPNNEGSANQICCGRLPSCAPHQSPRC